jgi:2-amino-4-hydroxy-6-hydroxymethyldihydropteridine diphosphokinase
MNTIAAYVALGANLGEPAAALDRAARRMDGICPGVRLAARSRIWHTAPKELEDVGYPWPECLREGVRQAVWEMARGLSGDGAIDPQWPGRTAGSVVGAAAGNAPQGSSPGAPPRTPDQPWYANMAVKLECPEMLAPETLFEALMRLETEFGRNRVMERRYGPRFIDIDLVAAGNAVMDTPRLTLPHPRVLARPFALLPLREIDPDFVPPETLESLSFYSSGTIIF